MDTLGMLSEHGLRSYRLTGAYCIDNNPIRNGAEDMCFIGDSQIASTSWNVNDRVNKFSLTERADLSAQLRLIINQSLARFT